MKILDIRRTDHLDVPELKELKNAGKISKEEVISKSRLALISIIRNATETLQNLETNPNVVFNNS